MNNFNRQYEKMLQDAQLAVVHFVNEFGVSYPDGDGKFLVIPENIQKEIDFDVQLINDRGDLLDSGYAEPLDEPAKIFIIADNLEKCIPMFRIWGSYEMDFSGDSSVEFFFDSVELENALNSFNFSSVHELRIETWNKEKKEWEDTDFSYIKVTDEGSVVGIFTGEEFMEHTENVIKTHADENMRNYEFIIAHPSCAFLFYMKNSNDFEFEITVK